MRSPTRRRVLQAAAALAAPAAGAAPRRPRIWQLLFRGETEAEQGFRDYLAERRYAVDLVVRDIDRDRRRLPGLVAEIRAERPDLVYTWGTPNALAVIGRHDAVDPARHVTDIPVVFAMVSDPVGAGLVPAWGGSGRNATGVSNSVPLDAQVKAMGAYRPLRRLGVVYSPVEPNSVANVESLRHLARRMGFETLARAVRLDARREPVAADVPVRVGELAAAGVDWIYIGPDTFIGDQRAALTGRAIELGVPVFTGTELEVRSSDALCGLVARYHTVGQLAAHKALQILQDGVPPGRIPVERIGSYGLVVNMRAARALSLYPPMLLLNYAELINTGG